MKRVLVLALSVILALALLAPMAAARPHHQKNVLGKLGAQWWNWAVEEPVGQNPLEGSYDESVPPGDIQCDGSNPSNVWFLAGTTSGEGTRACTAPANTPLFFPTFNVICSPATGDDPNDPRWSGLGFPGCAKWYTDNSLDQGSTTFAKVDGKDRSDIRAASGPFNWTLPENNIFGAEAGTYPAATDGRWVLLPPLSKGEHQVEFGGDFKDTPFGDFTIDVTYNLTVA